MGSVNEKHLGVIPKIRLSGKWLTPLGFVLDAIATAHADPGLVTVTLQKDVQYKELVRTARKNRLKILQIRPEAGQPHMGITGSFVDTAGFGLGDMLTADCSHGLIKLQKLDFVGIGF